MNLLSREKFPTSNKNLKFIFAWASTLKRIYAPSQHALAGFGAECPGDMAITPKNFLGLDAGGSGTKWAFITSSGQLMTGRAAPLTAALLATASGQQALRDLIQALPHLPQSIYAGIPGLAKNSLRAQQIAHDLAQAFGTLPVHVYVESDLDLAYRAHLAPGEGLVVYAGTGSIAYAVSQQGHATRAGGRGYRIGDEGGGASIGRSALCWVTNQLDCAGQPSGPLAEQIALITGGLDWDTLRDFIYSTPGAASLARVAPAVTFAAEAGDKTALALLETAAHSLANLAQCVRRQLELTQSRPPVITATGGALQSRPLQAALRRALPEVQIQFRDHAQVAAQLAYASATNKPG